MSVCSAIYTYLGGHVGAIAQCLHGIVLRRTLIDCVISDCVVSWKNTRCSVYTSVLR